MKKKLPAQIKALIDENPMADYSLTELADTYHVSKGTLMQQFKAVYGISIHQYLLLQRLEKACVLLRETDDKIIVIARYCGFRSEKHFMMLFKKHFSMSAGTYRELNGNA